MTYLPYRTSTLGPRCDRRCRLLVMGILLLVLGGLSILFLALSIYAIAMQRDGPAFGTGRRMLGGLLIYGGSAIFFFATGLGSILRKRWARPVVLAAAWAWLLTGVCGTSIVIYSIVRMQQTAGSSAGSWGANISITPGINSMIIVGGAISIVLYLGLPIALIALYRSTQVQETLDFYDRHARWTDGVPVRVLGLCFFMLVTAMGVLSNGFAGVAPLMGFLLTGRAAAIAMLIISGLFLLAAWWDYRLEVRGWLLSLALFIFLPVSTVITFLRTSTDDFYQALGMSFGEIQMAREMNGISMGPMLAWVVFGGVVGICYVWFVQVNFVEHSPEFAGPQDSQTAHLKETV
jgi:hypothetical protein